MSAPPKKTQQEKFQAILFNLLKDEENKYCADCDAKGPRWASWNIGVFLCIRCAGIHRNLGVHISRVKSVNLDSWTPEQLSVMMDVGNAKAKAAYEATLPENFRRPQTDSSLEQFIRQKYEQRKYTPPNWQPPRSQIRPELLENHSATVTQIEKPPRTVRPKRSPAAADSANQQPQSQTHSTSSEFTSPTSTPRPVASASAAAVQQNAAVAQPTAPRAAAPTQGIDLLLNFDDAAATSGVTSQQSGAKPNLLADDFFGELMSAPAPSNGNPTLTTQTQPQVQPQPQMQMQMQNPVGVGASVSVNDLQSVFNAPAANPMSASFAGGFPTLTPVANGGDASAGAGAGAGGSMSTSAILALYGPSQPRQMYAQPQASVPSVQQQMAGMNFGVPPTAQPQFAAQQQQFGRPNPFGVGAPSGMMQPQAFGATPANVGMGMGMGMSASMPMGMGVGMGASAGANGSGNLFDFGMPTKPASAAPAVNNLWQ